MKQPLFVYRGEQHIPIQANLRTRLFLRGFVIGGIGIAFYSLYRLIHSFSLLFFLTCLTGLFISAGYAWLWKKIQTQGWFPTLMEVHTDHLFLRKYQEQRKAYQEWVFPLQQIQVIIERRLDSHRGTHYVVPALHLFDLAKKDHFELFFDGDENINQFLRAVNEAGGVIRYLPYCLDYCSKEEKLQAFREETKEINFTGEISDYVPRGQEAYFYSERKEYKDVLLERRRKN